MPVRNPLWLPINALQAVLTILWSAVWITLTLGIQLLTRSRRIPLWMARRIWGPGLVALAGARVVVHGRERLDLARPVFLVANHQSWLDVPVLFQVFPAPVLFLAKQELAAVPFLAWYIRAMGMVFVERSARRKSVASVDLAAELLRGGNHLISFPEGTRSRDGVLQPFKSGAFGAAIAAGAPVLPVAIRGAGKVLPAGGFHVRPGRIEVEFGPVLPTTGLTQHNRHELATRAEAAVRDLLGFKGTGTLKMVPVPLTSVEDDQRLSEAAERSGDR